LHAAFSMLISETAISETAVSIFKDE